MTRTSRTPKKDETFIEALRKGASIARAARAAGYGRASVYEWRGTDPEFRAAWDEALDEGTDRLEDEAFRRAHDGTTRPIYYKGALIGDVQEYSDTLTIFLLKARRPEKFKDRAAVEHTGKDGGPIETVELSDNEFARRMAFLLAEAAEEKD